MQRARLAADFDGRQRCCKSRQRFLARENRQELILI
jgi:hypothetical protein